MRGENRKEKERDISQSKLMTSSHRKWLSLASPHCLSIPRFLGLISIRHRVEHSHVKEALELVGKLKALEGNASQLDYLDVPITTSFTLLHSIQQLSGAAPLIDADAFMIRSFSKFSTSWGPPESPGHSLSRQP